jgi:hypothetical protein
MGWTTIDGNTSWQELAIAQEIATAYNKRVSALSEDEGTAAGVSEITPAETMTVFDFVSAIQNGIEAMAPYWGDPGQALYGSTVVPSNYADAQSLLASAGLTESGGWRRIADGGTQPDGWTAYTAPGWSYGKIADKDLAGPWLFIDLQLALSAMTRQLLSSSRGSVRIHRLPESQPTSYGSWPDPIIPFNRDQGIVNAGIFGNSAMGAEKYIARVPGENPPYDYVYLFGYHLSAWGYQGDWISDCSVLISGDAEKDVTVLGKAYIGCGGYNGLDPVSWSTDLGTGWGGTDDQDLDNETVHVFKFVGSTLDPSVSYSVPPQLDQNWTTWGDVLASIPAPPTPPVSSINTRGLRYSAYVVAVAVDHHFDP